MACTHFVIVIFKLLLCVYTLEGAQCLHVNDTELLMTLLVHRHGDRTAYNKLIQFSNEPATLTQLSADYGEGELIKAGKRRSFKLGKLLRKRYGKFLGSRLSDDVFLQCTRINRTIMTAGIAIAAAYSQEPKWREDMELTPVDCPNVPLESDYLMMPLASCPTLAKHYGAISRGIAEEIIREGYLEEMQSLKSVFGSNITLYDLCQFPGFFSSQVELGLPLSPRIDSMMAAIERTSNKAFDILFGNQYCVDMQAGLLLRQFLDSASDTLLGKKTPKLRIYSSHDVNVYSLVAATNAPLQGIPNYCAAYALELRKVVDSEQIFVAAVYIDSPDQPERYLTLKGCKCELCDLEDFHRTTVNHTLDLETFKNKCGIKS